VEQQRQERGDERSRCRTAAASAMDGSGRAHV